MIQEDYHFASSSMGSEVFDWDQNSYEAQFVNNHLYEADATSSCDNPLFELDVDSTLDPNLGVSFDHSIGDSVSASRFQTELIEEVPSVYMVRNLHSFTFSHHVHDLFRMHNFGMHMLDMLDDSISHAVLGSRCCQRFDLLSYEFLSPVTDGIEIDRVQHDDPTDQIWELQEKVDDSRDISQRYP